MYYYELMLREGAALNTVVSDLDQLLSLLSDCEKHFEKVPYEFNNLSSAIVDLIEKIEIEIEENKQQEEFELQEKIKARQIYMTNQIA